jgi:2,3-diketo-5-methylthio-1-phosphopentane phosphatase
MSRLCIYHDGDPRAPHTEVTALAEIAAALKNVGVRFQRWPYREGVHAGASASEVQSAYAADIAQWAREHQHAAIDVVSMTPDHPERVATRAKFSREHRHLEDEVRFFADGAGLFCLHIGGEVYALVCERGDLLAVPAGVRHWFDMGSKPSFVALRFFDTPAGWVPEFTGVDIAQRFPGFEQLVRRTGVNVVLMDIEGTISPTNFVRQVLFPYARRRMQSFLRENGSDLRARAILESLRAVTDIDVEDEEAVLRQLLVWQDADVKIGPLKQLQGLIWEEGYREGALVAPLYPDARDRLCTWHRAGVPLGVYSSGSVHAQGLFFRHNRAGDIRSWFHGFYDTSVGSKHDEASYRRIAEKLGQPTSAVLFLSDSLAELDAARLAGMRTCHVLRESGEGDVKAGGLPRPCASSHTRVSSLLDVAL